MAVSHLSRLAIGHEIGERLGKSRPENAMKPRVFIMGYPGTGQIGLLDDLNADSSYGPMAVHMNMNTVAGNEAFVLNAAKLYPSVNFFGLNPGIISTNIRSNLMGRNTFRFRLMEL